MPLTQEQFTEGLNYDLSRVRDRLNRFRDKDIKEYAFLFHAIQNSDDIFRSAAEEVILQQCLYDLDKASSFETFKRVVKDRLIARARAGSRSTSDTSNLCAMYETAALAYVVSLFGE